MDNNLLKAKSLLKKYREGTCNEEEKAWVEAWYMQLNNHPNDLVDSELREDLQELKTRLDHITLNSPRRSLVPRIAAAILLFLSLGISIYWYAARDSQQTHLASQYGDDVLPGGNRATLTFSDGRSMPLSEAKEGIILSGEQFTYDDGEAISGQAQDVEYAILATPRGGQYKVTLPDGSRVFLNAASSLRYPTSFTGQRKVTLTGEAFFEVERNVSVPFVVECNGHTVEVLGTTFNINGYGGVHSTTLLTGSVRVTEKGSRQASLEPGQQSVWENGGLTVSEVDVAETVAWKDGLIVASSAALTDIIPQVERWYDVDFQIPSDLRNSERAYISIDRTENLSSVLKAMEYTYGIHFEIKGKEVIIRK